MATSDKRQASPTHGEKTTVTLKGVMAQPAVAKALANEKEVIELKAFGFTGAKSESELVFPLEPSE